MTQPIFFILGLIITLLLSVFFLLDLPQTWLTIFPAILPIYFLLFVCIGFLSFFAPRARYFVLGLLLPIAPICGRSIVSLVVLGWCVGYLLSLSFRDSQGRLENSKSFEMLVLSFILYLFSLLLAGYVTYRNDFDGILLRSYLDAEGLRGLTSFFQATNPSWYLAFRNIAEATIGVILALLIFLDTRRGEHYYDFRGGVVCGGMLSLVGMLFQLFTAIPFFQLNRNPFWELVGRYSAMYSDPNAFGVMSALIIPLCTVSLGAIIFIGALWSGSRTFFLGVGFYLIYYLIQTIRSSNPNRRRWSYRGIGLGLLVFLVLQIGAINNFLQLNLPSPGLKRIISSLSFFNVDETIESRGIYSEIALRAWQSSPVVGLGLERFYAEQNRFSADLALDGWRDNANNFYLQILSEQGLLGLALSMFVVFLLTLGFIARSGTKKSNERVRHISTVLVIFVGLLITGPHLHFVEVRYFIFALLGFGIAREWELRNRTFERLRSFGLILLVVIPPFFPLSLHQGDRTIAQGVYPTEMIGGERFIWAVNSARIHICLNDSSSFDLKFRLLHPDIAKNPVTVTFFMFEQSNVQAQMTRIQEPIQDVVSDNDWHDVLVEGETVGSNRKNLMLAIGVNRMWNPKKSKRGEDPRWLGVQLRDNAIFCPTN
jgi:hypothetical protein